MSSGLEGAYPSDGCMTSMFVLAVVGVIAVIIGAIAGVMWLWNHVEVAIR